MFKKVFLIVIFILSIHHAYAAGREIKCAFSQNNAPMTKSTCMFNSGKNGSFYLESTKPNGKVFLDYDMISVFIVAPGEAEVSSLYGAHPSNWGHAKRSTSEKACWVGSDFKICAY
jgi:hypothetical protein